jgi:DNA-binding transcriptional LysR family regulator
MGHRFYEQATQVLGRIEELQAMMVRAIGSERRRFVIG